MKTRLKMLIGVVAFAVVVLATGSTFAADIINNGVTFTMPVVDLSQLPAQVSISGTVTTVDPPGQILDVFVVITRQESPWGWVDGPLTSAYSAAFDIYLTGGDTADYSATIDLSAVPSSEPITSWPGYKTYGFAIIVNTESYQIIQGTVNGTWGWWPLDEGLRFYFQNPSPQVTIINPADGDLYTPAELKNIKVLVTDAGRVDNHIVSIGINQVTVNPDADGYVNVSLPTIGKAKDGIQLTATVVDPVGQIGENTVTLLHDKGNRNNP